MAIAQSPNLLSLLIIPHKGRPIIDRGAIGISIDITKERTIEIHFSFSRLPFIKVPIHLPIRNKYPAAKNEPTITRMGPKIGPK